MVPHSGPNIAPTLRELTVGSRGLVSKLWSDYGPGNRAQETGPPDERDNRDAKSFYETHVVGNCKIDLKLMVQT